MKSSVLVALVCLLFDTHCLAQFMSRATSDSLFKAQPYFSIYKDNYFVTGTTLDQRPTKYNSDAKYQISFKQLLTKEQLPFHLNLFLTYSQLAFWNVYQYSSPFAEINFNPSIGVSRRLFRHDRFVGLATLVVEHESNGKDSPVSRSWNRVSASFQGPITNKTILTVKAWAPFLYKGDGNSDILQYEGYGEVTVSHAFIPKKLLADITIRKGSKWDWRGAIQTQVDYRPFKNGNEYFMLQWFQGYGESLINYDVKVSMIRIGFIIKAPYLNVF